MDGGPNSGICHRTRDGRPVGCAQYGEVACVRRIIGAEDVSRWRNCCRVTSEDATAFRVPCVDMNELHRQHRRLHLVAPAVAAERQLLPKLRRPAVEAKLLDAPGNLTVVGGYRAGIAERAEVLGRIETERRDVAERTRAAPGMHGTMRLCAVFENSHVGAPDRVEAASKRRNVDHDSIKVGRDRRVRVRSRTAAMTASWSRPSVSGSTSTQTGVAPTSRQAPVANPPAFAAVTTSSPGLISIARSASSRASMPLPTITQQATPHHAANCAANRSVKAPSMKRPEASTSASAASSSG